MADLFRSLGEGVMVHYRFAQPLGRPWRAAVREGYRNRCFQCALGIDWHFVRTVVRERNALFILCCWNDATQMVSTFLARALGRRYALWTDTPDLRKRRPWWKAVPRMAVIRFAFGGAQAVMGTGPPALNALRQMGCAEEKLVNFPYFIDTGAYPVSRRSSPVRRYLSCGRLVQEKGFDLALRALAQAGGEFAYRIAGVGPEQENLRKLARELGIAERVEFRGWLEPQELKELLMDSDVLLHPALFEPYGVCVLEAMACGLVVIGSMGTGAVMDRIRDGVNGLVHKTGDVAGLAEKLRFIDPAMGVAARITAGEWPLSRAREILYGAARSCNAARLPL